MTVDVDFDKKKTVSKSLSLGWGESHTQSRCKLPLNQSNKTTLAL